MTTINDAYINALLADSAYVGGLTAGLFGDSLAGKLQTRMTPTLAAYNGKNFSVVTQIESAGSSFDATVWRANNADGTPNPNGKIYVSMRGTQQPTDFLVDADLAVTGNARAQVTDMINWWLRISTPVGQSANQVSAVGSLYVAAPSVPGQGLVTAADLAAGTEVNGHSLGGYLATAFTRLFGTQAHVLHTSTFNSAGFAPGSEAVFTNLQNLIGPSLGLGRFPSQTEQTNYFASNGLNLTTNSFYFNQQGQRVEVFNELDATQLGNHYMYKLTDALALGNALSQLDPTLTMPKFDAMLAAGSNQTAASIEGVFDAVRRALAGTNVTPLPPGDASGSADSRVTYHATLAAFQSNPIAKDLAGQLVIRLAGEDLRGAARNDFGALIALQDLSPVWITGKDAVADARLAQIWTISRAADYSDWQTDKTAAIPSSFTSGWIADRAALLQAIVTRNNNDITTGSVPDAKAPSGVVTFFEYYDPAAPNTIKVLSTQPATTTGLPEQHILFGNDQANTLTGYDNRLGDRLYSGAGNDTLDGKRGNDYLEGGKGTDTYIYRTGDGFDTILDSDGLGSIVYDGATLTGGAQYGDNRTYRSADGKHLYVRVDTNTLLIDGNIRVQAYQPGQLNIALSGPSASGTPVVQTNQITLPELSAGEKILSPTPQATVYTRWHLGNQYNDGTYQRVYEHNTRPGYYLYGNVTNPDYHPVIGSRGDSIYASVARLGFLTAASDRLVGSAGDDRIADWSGMGALGDLIEAGAGHDEVFGGQGNDSISGGADSDILDGGAGDDLLYADAPVAVDVAVATGSLSARYSGMGSGAQTVNSNGWEISPIYKCYVFRSCLRYISLSRRLKRLRSTLDAGRYHVQKRPGVDHLFQRKAA
jgi:trimeric autotransporter adhesin